eukprot:6231639-Alexandrium_andersonii.AAC.1
MDRLCIDIREAGSKIWLKGPFMAEDWKLRLYFMGDVTVVKSQHCYPIFVLRAGTVSVPFYIDGSACRDVSASFFCPAWKIPTTKKPDAAVLEWHAGSFSIDLSDSSLYSLINGAVPQQKVPMLDEDALPASIQAGATRITHRRPCFSSSCIINRPACTSRISQSVNQISLPPKVQKHSCEIHVIVFGGCCSTCERGSACVRVPVCHLCARVCVCVCVHVHLQVKQCARALRAHGEMVRRCIRKRIGYLLSTAHLSLP